MASVDRDEVERLLTEIGQRFADLLVGPDFLITNDSMGDLVRTYWADLVAAWKAKHENALMDTWRNDLAAFRAAWLEIAAENVVTFHGTNRSVATESATSDARGQCARRKERRGKRHQQ